MGCFASLLSYESWMRQKLGQINYQKMVSPISLCILALNFWIKMIIILILY